MEILPGTVVAVKGRDFVVIGGEKRLSYDGFILSRMVRKVYPITDHCGVGFAGLFGDINYVVRVLKLEARSYALEYGREINPRGLAKVLSVLLYSYKFIPLLTEVVVGGLDRDWKPSLYVLDPVGSLIEEKYVALGSGGRVALGYLEPNYREDITMDNAKKLVINSIKVAVERDVASGDGVDLLVISREGHRIEEYLFEKKFG